MEQMKEQKKFHELKTEWQKAFYSTYTGQQFYLFHHSNIYIYKSSGMKKFY